jgi:hypothetical protein
MARYWKSSSVEKLLQAARKRRILMPFQFNLVIFKVQQSCQLPETKSFLPHLASVEFHLAPNINKNPANWSF